MSPEMYATAAQWGGSISSATFFSAAGKTLQGVFLFGPELFSEMGTMGNTGLVLLFFLPLLPLANRIPPVVKVLCFSCALLFSALIMRFACIRFFYPGIMFLLIIAAYVLMCLLKQLPRPFKPFLFCAAVICIVVNAGMGMYQVNMRTMTYGADFLHDSDDRYLRRHMIGNKEALLDSYPVNCYINENTRPDARILIIGDVQHLYIKRRHLYTYLSATTPYDPLKNCSGDCRDTRQALKEKGITHILFSPFELKRLQEIGAIAWKKEDNPHMENFFKSPCVRRIYASKRPAIEVILFELM